MAFDRKILWRNDKPDETEIILLRHGESEANVGISTDPNCVLTPRGIEQARVVGERLRKMNLSQHRCLVSPYHRTRATAGYITGLTGLEFEIEPAIREWGKPCTIDDILYSAESRHELALRMAAFLESIRGSKILLVSHAAPIAELIRLAEGRELDFEIECFWTGIDNCCLIKLTES